jgi:hypothetical protein
MYRNDEPPDYSEAEECVCGKPNATDDGEQIDPKHPGFCSKGCHDFYMAQQAKDAEGLVEALAERDGFFQ